MTDNVNMHAFNYEKLKTALVNHLQDDEQDDEQGADLIERKLTRYGNKLGDFYVILEDNNAENLNSLLSLADDLENEFDKEDVLAIIYGFLGNENTGHQDLISHEEFSPNFFD